MTSFKCQEIVKHLPPYSRFKTYVFWLPAWWAMWLLWWPLTDAAMFQCVYGYLQSVFFFLVLFHCCIFLEIKLTTTTKERALAKILIWHLTVLMVMSQTTCILPISTHAHYTHNITLYILNQNTIYIYPLYNSIYDNLPIDNHQQPAIHTVYYGTLEAHTFESYITLRPRQNDRRFADDTFKRIFLNENVRILIKISLKFVPKGPINNNPALVQIMA